MDEALIQKARDRGFTDEQIQSYLQSQRGTAPVETQPVEAATPSVTPQEQPVAPTAPPEQPEIAAPVNQHQAMMDRARSMGYSDLAIAQYEATKRQTGLLDKLTTKYPEPSEDLRSIPTGVDRDTDSRPTLASLRDGATEPRVELGSMSIMRRAKDLGVDPTTQSGVDAVYKQYRDELLSKQYSSDVATYSALANTVRPWQWMKSHFGAAANQEYLATEKANVDLILELAQERGINLQYQKDTGTFNAVLGDGTVVPADPGFFASMESAKYEIAGGLAGASLAYAKTKEMRAAGPKGRAANVLAAMIGGVGGAVIGNQTDYLAAAVEAQADWSARMALDKSMSTAQLAVVGEIVGFGVFKAASATIKQAETMIRAIKDGNTKGAYSIAKEVFNLSDDQINEMITRIETLEGRSLPHTSVFDETARQEKGIAAIILSHGGAESLARDLSSSSLTAPRTIANYVNARAKDLKQFSTEGVDAGTGRQILDALKDYETGVKVQFDQVKQYGIDLVGEDYSFSLPDLAIKPLLRSRIEDLSAAASPKAAGLQGVLSRIEELTDTRSFEDLIELRHVLNDFKFNRSLVTKADRRIAAEAVGSVDREINKVVDTLGEEGSAWLSHWKEANTQYSQYKNLQKNALFKVVSRKGVIDSSTGVSEDSLAKVLLKYAPSIDKVNLLNDTTYTEVMRRLPQELRGKVENKIVDLFIDKNTVGAAGEAQAVYFPKLSKAIEAIEFTTPRAKYLKEAIDELGRTFGNDPKLGAATGSINIPMATQALSSDIGVKVRMTLASRFFNRLRALTPGKEGQYISLIRKAGTLLEEPLDSRATADLVRSLKGDDELITAVTRMQADISREMAEGGVTRVQLYKDSKGRQYARPGKGRTSAGTSVPAKRVISQDIAESTLGVERLDKQTLDAYAKKKLVDNGFAAIVLDTGEVVNLLRSTK